MTAEQFVKAFHDEKQYLLKEYLSSHSETEVAKTIKSLNLNKEQTRILEKVLDSSFKDILYTILLALDGTASIGGIQEMYEIKDENGNLISGEIESYAYEYFNESK